MKFIRSLISIVLMLVLSSILVFTITRMMPLSPEQMLLSTYDLPQTDENINMLKEEWGLDAPLYVQYFTWAKGMLVGDWGNSLISKIEIKDEFMKRLPFSLCLGLGSLLMSVILGFFIGYLAAVKKGFFEMLSRGLTLFSQSVPNFIAALFVIYVIGIKFDLVNFFTGDPWKSTFIGILLIAITTCGGLSRVARQHFIEISDKTYIKRLYASGFRYDFVMLRHGFKPVIFGMIGAVVSRFASILGGSTVIEFAFSIPGINFFLIESIKNRDYYVIQSYMLLVMVWMTLVHVIFRWIKIKLDKRQRAY